jgi:hypothetical protein
MGFVDARMLWQIGIASRLLGVGSPPNKPMQPTAGQRVSHRELAAPAVEYAAANWQR